MLKTLLHCLLISTAVFAADNSDPFSSPTSSSSKSERVILSEESGEPSAKKQRVDTPYETMYMFLPDELIVKIATFARIGDGIQMSSTCKNWKQALDQSDIWERYANRLPGYEFFKDAPCFKKKMVQLIINVLLKRQHILLSLFLRRNLGQKKYKEMALLF